MTMGLATGYFIWNILAWISIFLFTALILCAAVYIAVSRRAGRLVHIPQSLERRGIVLWGFEIVLRNFRVNFTDPFVSSPMCHAAALAAIAALLFAALFSENGTM